MNYTIDNENIRNVALIILIMVVIAIDYYLATYLPQYIKNQLFLFLILYLISLFLGTWGLYQFFSYIFFKIPILKNSVPNFSGVWVGKGVSTFKSGKEFDMKLEIRQTLTSISINGYFSQSKSEAFNFYVEKKSHKEKLYYNYFSEPNPQEILDKHYGTIILEKHNNILRGTYFTDRVIQTKGSFYLRKKM